MNTKMTCNIKEPARACKPFREITVGDFVLAPDHKHVGMKIDTSVIRWFPLTADEYAVGVNGREYGISSMHIYSLPASVHVEVVA